MKWIFITLLLLPMALSIQHLNADRTMSALTTAARHVAASKMSTQTKSGFLDVLGLNNAPADQVALQVGNNYTEMAEITAQLDALLSDLELQDNADDARLAEKTANHTAAIAVTASANATVASSHTALHDAQAQLATEQAALSTATSDADESVAHRNAELVFAGNIQQALDSLIAVDAEPEELIALGDMANQLADRHPAAVAAFHQTVSLVQGPYSSAAAVQSAITDLIAAINQKKLEAQQSVVDAQAVVDAASAAVAAAAAGVVVMETRQAAAMGAEYAALQDLETTTAAVAASKAATEQTRQEVLAIKDELLTLGGVESTDNNFAQVLSLLAAGTTTSKYDDIISAIQAHLMNIMGKIDAEEYSEQIAKNNRLSEWNALRVAETPLIETSNVKTAALGTLDTNIAQAQGVLDSANSALQEEIDHQLREKSFFTQLRDLLDVLPAMTIEGGGGLVQTDRAHTDFTTQFEQLITALEADMVSTKSSLQATRDRDAQDHAGLVSSRVAVALEAEQAETAEQNAIAATQAAQQVYLTANTRYMANHGLRTEERTIIMRIQTLVANLGSA